MGRLGYIAALLLSAGAWGAKINGSGGGGCMFACVSAEKTGAVSRAIEAAGGKAVEIAIDSGLTVEALNS